MLKLKWSFFTYRLWLWIILPGDKWLMTGVTCQHAMLTPFRGQAPTLVWQGVNENPKPNSCLYSVWDFWDWLPFVIFSFHNLYNFSHNQPSCRDSSVTWAFDKQPGGTGYEFNPGAASNLHHLKWIVILEKEITCPWDMALKTEPHITTRYRTVHNMGQNTLDRICGPSFAANDALVRVIIAV